MSPYARTEDETGATVTVRAARPEDYDAVAAFTADTWADREVRDYLPDVYREWVAAADGRTRQTFVLDLGDDPPTADLGAIVSVVVLSPYEAWAQGLRVAPEYRGRGLATVASEATFDFAREAGATVIRNMVFSWNVPSLGLSRRAGYEPGIAFRWAHPTPDAGATVGRAAGGAGASAGAGAHAADASIDADVTAVPIAAGDDADPDAAWAFWTRSAARTELAGLALDPAESWALSALTRERVHVAAESGRLLVVGAGPTRGFALRNRTYDRETDDGGTETWAEYAVGAWAERDAEAAAALLAAVARDAAGVDADRTRVLIPEGVAWVTDAASARADLAERPTFVLAADLT